MPNETNFQASTPGATVTGTLRDNLPIMPVAPGTGRVAIGPRVTFNFITEAWNNANSYQYYDVVQVSGNSYIARQNVPAGIEITDTDYWVHWADPNAQYQELYNVVQTFQSSLTTLQSSVETLQDEMQKLTSGDTYSDLASNGFVYKEV